MTDASANKRAWAEAFDTEASSADGVEVHVFVGLLAEDAEKRLVIGPATASLPGAHWLTPSRRLLRRALQTAV